MTEGEGFFTVSDGRMKYIHVAKSGREHYELFGMEKDPLEFDNVIDRPEYAQAVVDLRNAANLLFMKNLLA